jgi:hypothetical protein
LRETKEGGVERLEMLENALKMERECISAMLEEERCLAKRLEKKERLQRAWRLGMEAKRYARMIRMLEELSVDDMEMEVESIEMIVNKMMEIEDWAGEDDTDWQEDIDGDQVMTQVKVVMVTEEEGDMEVSGWVDVNGQEAHTPLPRTKIHTGTANIIMTAVHTHLLGTLGPMDTLDRTLDITESGAGISDLIGRCDNIHTRGYNPDMKKLLQSHGSPKCVSSISLDKTPSVVGAD